MRLSTYKGNDTVYAVSYEPTKREEVLNAILSLVNQILNDNIVGELKQWFGWKCENDEQWDSIIEAVKQIDGIIAVKKITTDTPEIEKYTAYLVWDDVNNVAILDSEDMREEYIEQV